VVVEVAAVLGLAAVGRRGPRLVGGGRGGRRAPRRSAWPWLRWPALVGVGAMVRSSRDGRRGHGGRLGRGGDGRARRLQGPRWSDWLPRRLQHPCDENRL